MLTIKTTLIRALIITLMTTVLMPSSFSEDVSRQLASPAERVKDFPIWKINTKRQNSIIAFNPNGKSLANGSFSGEIGLWDVNKRFLIDTFDGHTKSVRSVAFDSTGKLLVSGSLDNTVRIWNVKSRKLIHTFKGHLDAVNWVTFSPNDKTIASASDDSTIKVWSLEDNSLIHSFEGHKGIIYSISFHPNGKTLISGAADKTIKVWNVTTKSLLRTLTGHSGSVYRVHFSPDGTIFASGSNDRTVKLWETDTKKNTHTFKEADPESSIAFSPDGNLLALSGNYESSLTLWDIEQLKPIHLLKLYDRGVSSISFSPDGNSFALSSQRDSKIRHWDINSMSPIHTFSGRSTETRNMTFNSSGSRLALISYQDANVQIWDFNEKKLMYRFQRKNGILSPPERVFFYDNDKKVLILSADQTITKWNLEEDTSEDTPLEPNNDDPEFTWEAVFNPDKTMVATAITTFGETNKNTIQLRNVEDNKLIQSLDGHSESITSLAFSPDGKTLASASDDMTVKLWDIANKSLIHTFVGHQDRIASVSFSFDGKTLASGSYDKTIRIWDIENQKSNFVLKGHEDSVFSVDFHPSKRVLTSASTDKTIRIWDIESRLISKTFRSDSKLYSAIFSPTGDYVVSSGENLIQVWSLEENKLEHTMVSGSKGSWFSADEKGNFKRGDNIGDLFLVKKGNSYVPAPPSKQMVRDNERSKLSLSIKEASSPRKLNLGEITELNISVHNSGKNELFWIQPILNLPNRVTLIQPQVIPSLGPGKTHNMQIKITPRLLSNYSQTENGGKFSKSAPLTNHIPLKIISPQQAHSEIIVPIKVNSPQLKLASSTIIYSGLSRVLNLRLENFGTHSVKNLLIDLKVPGLLKLDTQTISSNITPNGAVERSFAISDDFEFTKDTKIDVSVRTRSLPFLKWDFNNQVVTPPEPRWLLYVSLILLSLFTVISIFYFRRYRHPLVVELSESPKVLLNLPIEQLDEAHQRLSQTNRLDKVLSDAEVGTGTLRIAADFNMLSDIDKAQLLAKRLAADAKPIFSSTEPKESMTLYELKLPEGFPLNIDKVLLCFPNKTDAEDVVTLIKQHSEAQSRITLIVGNNSAYQRNIYAKTNDNSNKMVAPQGFEITRLLLSPDAETTFAEILSGQLSLQQISPYRIGGGVNNESVFFGRRELISQIINRDPANYLMAGGRQVGKSTLLKAIERRYEDSPQVECVYLTLSSEVLVPRLASMLELERTDNAEVLATQLDDRIRESGLRFVFLIDEADRFISQEKAQDYAILNVFRRLSEEGNCTFILAGFWQLYQHAVLDYQSPIRNFGELLSVGELEKPACIELVTQPMKTMNLAYANETLVEHIVDSCGQRANLIAIACQHIVRNLSPKQRVIEAGDVDKTLRSDELRRALSGWVVGETEHEQAYERMVVYATIAMPSFTTGELLELARQHGVAIDTLVLDRTLSRLGLAFVLGRKDGHWFYRVPLFVDYIAEDSPELKLQAELSRIGQYG